VLYIHEVHEVRGRAEDDFESAFKQWLDLLAKGDDARLLWYAHLTHGTGDAYNVVTITAVRDGQAWEGLAKRLQTGDLAQWQTDVDAMRHAVTASVMLPVPWSPMQTVDLAMVPTTPQDHEPAIYMEDTGWPHAALADYIAFWERGYYTPMNERPREQRLLDIEFVMQPAYGAGRRKEAILWQRVLDHDRLLKLLIADTPPELKAPGMFMHEALGYRDQWRSRLLRTSRWSPLG
jgi:hypothetical protein